MGWWGCASGSPHPWTHHPWTHTPSPRVGQQAGYTHPTGMLSCLYIIFMVEYVIFIGELENINPLYVPVFLVLHVLLYQS